MYSAKPSYWEKSTFLSSIDIAIIGAGLVGTTAALYAKRKFPDAKVVVIDRGFIGSGASTKNAGFACFGSLSELLDDLEVEEESTVFDLLARRYEGLKHLLELLGKDHLDYKPLGGFEIFRQEDKATALLCTDKINYFNRKVRYITCMDKTYSLEREKITSSQFANVTHCIANRAEGQLHPGKMMERLYRLAQAEGVRFFHGIEVNDFEDSSSGVEIKLSNGWTFSTNQLVVANNGFARKLIPALNLEAVRNQVLVTAPIPSLSLKGAFHLHKGFFYFRNIKNRVLIGGGRHLCEEAETTDSFGSNTLIEASLRQLLNEVVIPNVSYKLESKWSGILGVGPSKQPILKKYSMHVTLAVRLGGMGVALGSALGRDVIELI